MRVIPVRPCGRGCVRPCVAPDHACAPTHRADSVRMLTDQKFFGIVFWHRRSDSALFRVAVRCVCVHEITREELMGKRKSTAVAPALTSEQVAALLALLAAAPASTPAPAKPRKAKAKPSGDVVASASGFTFAWTREKVKRSGAVQYRLVIADASGRTLTRDAGYPYAVKEQDGTLAARVAAHGVPAFALGLAKSLARA